ncbi:MAG: hypothetical protein KA387_04490 [Rubrivivax sp.]|jgi:hypothetical protein|nr:hypothetical protein [Rubrivivax sp.]MBP6319419.1 hypothetical protein [Rubrivivax sp.]
MTERVKVRATRTLLHSGRRFEAGEFLDLAPAAAADALESGRVELVDAADRPAVLAGRRAEVVALMRREQRTAPPADGPWFPMNY